MWDVCPALKVVVVSELTSYFTVVIVLTISALVLDLTRGGQHYCYQVVCSYDIKCSYCHGCRAIVQSQSDTQTFLKNSCFRHIGSFCSIWLSLGIS
jgi:hypothetical protein